jgi:hypothetical protein
VPDSPRYINPPIYQAPAAVVKSKDQSHSPPSCATTSLTTHALEKQRQQSQSNFDKFCRDPNRRDLTITWAPSPTKIDYFGKSW